MANFRDLLRFFGNDPGLLKQFREAGDFYEEQYKNAVDQVGIPSTLASFYELVNQIFEEIPSKIKSTISCKKGCAFCCKIPIIISDDEAEFIVEYCKENNIEINEKYLRQQITYERDTWAFQENAACVFLDDDNTCKIYDVRPMICRKHLVRTPAEFCDPVTHPGHEIGIHLDWNTEAMAFAIMRGKEDLLPVQLLKTIKK